MIGAESFAVSRKFIVVFVVGAVIRIHAEPWIDMGDMEYVQKSS